jgi:hypothetical protein
VTLAGTVARAFGSKVAVNMKKTVMPARKRRVPSISVMAEACSTKSQESSPHVPVA